MTMSCKNKIKSNLSSYTSNTDKYRFQLFLIKNFKKKKIEGIKKANHFKKTINNFYYCTFARQTQKEENSRHTMKIIITDHQDNGRSGDFPQYIKSKDART